MVDRDAQLSSGRGRVQSPRQGGRRALLAQARKAISAGAGAYRRRTGDWPSDPARPHEPGVPLSANARRFMALYGISEADARKLGHANVSRAFQHLRAKFMVELAIRGYPARVVGPALGVSEDLVNHTMRQAAGDGTIEEVLKDLREVLREVPAVYETILKADPAELTKHARGLDLKLRAAESLSKGTGTFKSQSVTRHENVDLLAMAAQGPEAPALPETIDGEVVRAALPAAPAPSDTEFPPA